MEQTVGVIGLGIMGGAFAANLLAAGFKVIGFDLDRAPCEALAERGGVPAASPRDVAERADIVVLSLPSAAALQRVVGGHDGLASSGRGGVIVMDCSTLAVADKERARAALDETGMILLDCPISGTGPQARSKDVIVFASGDRAAFEACVPVVEGFARRHRYLGGFGDGSRLKLVANLLVAEHIAATAEAMVLAIKAGLDPRLAYEVLAGSPASSRMFDLRAPSMVRDDYHPAMMKMSLWRTDIEIIGDFVAGLGAKTPLFDAATALFRQALEEGDGLEDTAAVCRVVEKLSEVER